MLVAAKSSQEVIDYVSANNDAIGLVGCKLVGDKNDPQALSFLQR
jgi:phosphate transport system substrate-binding protein